MTLDCRRLVLALALVPALACGKDEPPAPTGKQPRTEPTKAEPPPVAGSGSTGGTGSAPEEVWQDFEDPLETSGGETDGETGEVAVATGGEAEGPKLHVGPCSVSWSKAARLRFKYTDDGSGGTVRIDGDRDGKSDVCASFEFADGRTTRVDVDEGCDKKSDGTIEPAYDEKSNLATATLTEPDGTTEELTLVALPSFSGVAPGYVLYAAKKDIKLKIRKGQVRSAVVTSPSEGPPVKVDFTYDKEGRVKRISEDFDNDGSVDRKYDYRFDDAGNVKRVTLTVGPKDEQTKTTASLSYKCWDEPEAG